MRALLRIDSSLRNEGSYSRAYGDDFIQLWKEKYPDNEVRYRDVNTHPLPHLSQKVREAFYNRSDISDNLTISDSLCKELQEIDVLLITCPMYNFGVPSTLKAYFDHIVRVNQTFEYDENGYKGLLKNKKAYLITAMGDRKTNPNEPAHFEDYLFMVLRFMGIDNIELISIHGTGSKNFITDQRPQHIQQIKHII